jgi:hypothetical protein
VIALLEEDGLVIDNLGWVDGSCLWTFELSAEQAHLIPTGSAKHIGLRRYGDVFRIIHHQSITPSISLRRTSDLRIDAAKLEVLGQEADFSGDASLWDFVDPCALVPTGRETLLMHLDASNGRTSQLNLDWYWDGDYDLGYQGLVDCLTLPGREQVIVSVQRSSRLVIVDILQNKKTAEFELAGRSGNPKLQFWDENHIITVDYDTVCLVDLRTMQMVATARLQNEINGVRCFAGDARLDRDGVIVARPFSGDVVLLDRRDLTVIRRAVTGHQPLNAVQVSSSGVLGRDLKTGAVLRASFA